MSVRRLSRLAALVAVIALAAVATPVLAKENDAQARLDAPVDGSTPGGTTLTIGYSAWVGDGAARSPLFGSAVFVRPRFVPNDGLLTALGCAADPNGWALVDATGATSVPGVWAAGNAVNARAQVITAAGEGSAAAIAINNGLVEDDLPAAVAGYRDGLPA